MHRSTVRIVLFALALLVSGCSESDPGPLKGTWQVTGPVRMTLTFRSGETEAMGVIEKVSYSKEGDDILVTYKDGIAKGTTMRYRIAGPDTVRSGLGTLRRVRK